MKKRILSTLLMLTLCVILLPMMGQTAQAASGTALTQDNISGNTTLSGGSYYLNGDITISSPLTISGTVTLDLNGYVLNYTGSNYVIEVKGSATLTLTDSTPGKTHYFTKEDSGLWKWNSDSTETEYTVSGGVITGGYVSIWTNGSFIMNSGNIVGCTHGDYGGGVYVYNGSFTMNGGSIVGCIASLDGGGVCVSDGSFSMTGGTIKHCVAQDGSGVSVLGTGSFNMSGGTISDCTASHSGGGMYVNHKASFTISGNATIDSCTAKYGGACFNQGTLYANGGTINGNVYNEYYSATENSGTITRNASGTGIDSYTLFNGTVTNFNSGATIDDAAYPYTVTFTGIDGQTVGDVKVLKGQAVSAPDYSFTGYTITWKKDGETTWNFNNTVTSTMTLKATKTGNTYTVEFYSASGQSAAGSMSPQTFTYGESQALTANKFSRTGYTFQGWATKYDGTVMYKDGATVSDLTAENGGTVTLYAVWQANTYTVRYDANNGTGDVTTSTFTYGNRYIILACNFSKLGYYLEKWNTKEDGTGTSYSADSITSTLIPDDGGDTITLYAIWTPNQYYVQFYPNGATSGLMEGTQYFRYGTPQNLRTNRFVRTGYTFLGWAKEENATQATYTDGAEVENLTTNKDAIIPLYAVWTLTTYTIEYNLNGGTNHADNPATYTMESGNITLKEPTRTGYTFTGWSGTGLTGTANTSVQINGGSTGNRQYTANWKANTYTVSFDANGATSGSMAEQNFSYGTPQNLNTNGFTRTGYTFLGWAEDADATAATYTDGEQVKNLTAEDGGSVTLYAVWQANTYTVRFNANGGSGNTMADQSFTYDADPVSLTKNTYTRHGYTFLGWAEDADATAAAYTDGAEVKNLTNEVNGTVTLYTVWTLTPYTIEYNLNGGTNHADNPETYTIASENITLKEPTRTGYTFTGWSGTDLTGTTNTSVAINSGSTGNREYTANWQAHAYTVSFDANGGSGDTMDSQSFIYDDLVALTKNTYTRSGYTFLGWSKEENATAATYTDEEEVKNLTADDGGTVTLYAVWKRISSGNSTSTATTITIPVSSDHATVEVKAEVSKGNATVEVSDKQIEKVIADHAGEVTIDVSDLKNVESATVPSHVVEKTNEAENTGLTVSLPAGSVTLDETALERVTENANGKDVTVSVVAVQTEKLPTAVKNIIGMEPTVLAVVDVNVSIAGKKQSSFDGGKVKISIPYTPKPGEDTSKLTVWFVKDDGTIENKGGYYDAKNKCFVFETDHLSQYILVNPNAAPAFVDVPANAYFADAVKWAAKNGITGGVDGTHFMPYNACTRAQIVTFLWRAAGSPEPKTASSFTDVPENAYYAKAVAWAVENGITNGFADGTFGVNTPCTRAHAAAFLFRYAQSAGVDVSVGEDTNILSFNDAFDVPEYAVSAFQWAVGAGILNGNNGNLMPNNTCTRAQIVTMLYRMLGK